MSGEGSAVPGEGIAEGGEHVEGAALRVGVGAVEVEEESFGVGPVGELAQVGPLGGFERAEPVLSAACGGGEDEPEVALVVGQHIRQGGGGDGAGHDQWGEPMEDEVPGEDHPFFWEPGDEVSAGRRQLP